MFNFVWNLGAKIQIRKESYSNNKFPDHHSRTFRVVLRKFNWSTLEKLCNLRKLTLTKHFCLLFCSRAYKHSDKTFWILSNFVINHGKWNFYSRLPLRACKIYYLVLCPAKNWLTTLDYIFLMMCAKWSFFLKWQHFAVFASFFLLTLKPFC